MKLQSVDAAYDLTTGRGRLRYLADEVLARVTREELPFNLNSWFSAPSRPHDCGTAACAAGWAARDDLLRLHGLGYPLDGHQGYPTVNGIDDYEVFANFWGLKIPEAHEIFMPGCYVMETRPTAADVAARIRAYLAATEPTP